MVNSFEKIIDSLYTSKIISVEEADFARYLYSIYNDDEINHLYKEACMLGSEVFTCREDKTIAIAKCCFPEVKVLLLISFENLPLFINDPSFVFKEVIKWRLHIGK